jgi:hypothetical protein
MLQGEGDREREHKHVARNLKSRLFTVTHMKLAQNCSLDPSLLTAFDILNHKS